MPSGRNAGCLAILTNPAGRAACLPASPHSLSSKTQTTQLDSDETQREVRYYISSLYEPASSIQSHIRQHWRIENSCHWVVGTAFREDHNQTYIGHAAKNLGALRRIVLNLLKIDLSDTRSLPKKRRRAMLDLNYRNSLLSLA